VPHDLRVIMYDVMVAGALRHFLREGTIDTEHLAVYRNHGHYVSAVAHTDRANLGAGYLLPADVRENLKEAAHSDVGKTK
jgi:hypothetical protein